jgi:hypothetical protein
MTNWRFGPASQWRQRHPVLGFLACFAIAGPIAIAGVFSTAMGSCHDAGGFCSGDWDFWLHGVELYGGGVLLMAAGATITVLGLGRRPRAAVLVGVAVVVLAAAVIIANEPRLSG